MKVHKTHIVKKITLNSVIFLFLLFINTTIVFAENGKTNELDSPAPANISPEQTQLAKFKRAARKLLLSRLMDKDGKSIKIVILPPMDYTTLQTPDVITESIQRGIRMYDDTLNVQRIDYKMKSLTLEQFRDAVTKLNAELLFVTVLHPNNFDMYLYDKRTPFQIYAHSEPIATSAQHELNAEIANYYSKILIRRTLYRYIKKQSYSLPRDETPPLLKTELPRSIASVESLETINNEMTLPFLAQVGIGASISKGANSELWNSSALAISLGYRLLDKTFMKVGIELSAYNVFMGGVSYLFANKERLFKTEIGISVAKSISEKTLDWDRTNGIESGALHIVPNAAFIVPIMDVSFRMDAQLFIGLNGKSMIFTVIPGLGISF